MKQSIFSSLVVGLIFTAFGCGDSNKDEPNCDGISNCSAVGVRCEGDMLTTCALDANSCLVASSVDCSAGGGSCDTSVAEPVCSSDSACEDDLACDGANDGDSFCKDGATISCSTGADGCLDASEVACTELEICDAAGAAPACVLACEDHPLCAGAADGELSCDGFFLNACSLAADGCLDLMQNHCGTALCDDAQSPAVCGVSTASGLSCGTAIAVVASGFNLAGTDFVSDFAGGINLEHAECRPTDDAATVGVVLEVALMAGDVLDVTQDGEVSTIISVLQDCAVNGACVVNTADASARYTATVAETVSVVVENIELAPADGAYNIQVFINAACGNGQLEPGETCDDANLDSGDGCATDCTPEFYYECDSYSPSNCTLLPSLGSYGIGETVTPFEWMTAVAADEVGRYRITFTDGVHLSGTLAANGTADFDMTFDTQDETVLTQADVGNEDWTREFVPAGSYVVSVELYEGVGTNFGYKLEMNTGSEEVVSVASGAAGNGTGAALDSGSSTFLAYTFSEDVELRGSLTGTGGADFDLEIFGTANVITEVVEEGDEVFNINLPAGTYQFVVASYSANQNDFSLDFNVTSSSSTSLGSFSAGQSIADLERGPLVARVFEHHEITFTEDVFLSGSLDRTPNIGIGMFLYNSEQWYVNMYGGAFSEVLIPAGTYVIQIQAMSEALAGGDIETYTLRLATSLVE